MDSIGGYEVIRKLILIGRSLAFLVGAMFCLFGFMASFEGTNHPERFFVFRVIYAVIGVSSLARSLYEVIRMFTDHRPTA